MSHNTYGKRFNGVIIDHETQAANTAGNGFFKGEELEVGLPGESRGSKCNATPDDIMSKTLGDATWDSPGKMEPIETARF